VTPTRQLLYLNENYTRDVRVFLKLMIEKAFILPTLNHQAVMRLLNDAPGVASRA
jgi:hypothetical protein